MRTANQADHPATSRVGVSLTEDADVALNHLAQPVIALRPFTAWNYRMRR
ncbi:MAG: hypothetical protein ACXVCO_11590 [Ktedonobacterales bacterium]